MESKSSVWPLALRIQQLVANKSLVGRVYIGRTQAHWGLLLSVYKCFPKEVDEISGYTLMITLLKAQIAH